MSSTDRDVLRSPTPLLFTRVLEEVEFGFPAWGVGPPGWWLTLPRLVEIVDVMVAGIASSVLEMAFEKGLELKPPDLATRLCESKWMRVGDLPEAQPV